MVSSSRPPRRSARLASLLDDEPVVIEQPAIKKQKKTPEVKPVTISTVPEKPTKITQLNIGDPIPKDLALLNQDAKSINLLQLSKKTKYLVVFLYPRASTPGCTRQAKGFRDNFETFKNLNTTVVGLSIDNPKSQTNFKVKQNLQYDLLCDPDRLFIGLLGAKKSPTGVIRSHFVFVDGVLTVSKVKISPEQSITGAVEQVKTLIAEAENGK